jgi:hypothetical protein
MVRRMGSQHFGVIRLKGELADTYEGLGQWDKSEPLRREVYAAYVEHRGSENEVTVGKEYLVVRSLLELGRKEEARNHVLHILEIRERLYDAQDPITQRYRHLLASIGPAKRSRNVSSQTANALTSFRIDVNAKSVPSGTGTTGPVRHVRRPSQRPPIGPEGPHDL